ncbi:hypothetical protein A0256_24325 [Mucilaginibacter sp. PAMC 26640]|nr:hypothetical protein A0256_24325 [Mucilaginibacter sp. PAMC 26640]
MNLQFIHDTKGNTTGVFIPIEEWQLLTEKYTELQEEELSNQVKLNSWQTELIDERLNDYYANSARTESFDDMLTDIAKTL